MNDDEAKEAIHLMKWYVSRKLKRQRVMHAAGGWTECRQETMCHMLQHRPKVAVAFSTWVINAWQWRLARLVHKENRQVNTQEYDDHAVQCSLLSAIEIADTQDGLWTIVQRELDERSFRCLRKHCEGMTLEEIAKPEGVTRERVRQIIVKAVRTLQVHQVAMRLYEAAGLRWFDDEGMGTGDSGSGGQGDEDIRQLDE